jgi:hypothetical protein
MTSVRTTSSIQNVHVARGKSRDDECMISKARPNRLASDIIDRHNWVAIVPAVTKEGTVAVSPTFEPMSIYVYERDQARLKVTHSVVLM